MTAAGVLGAMTFGCVVGIAACGPAPGYSEQNPTEITCSCHSGASCYDQAAELAERAGETAESGERLLYFAQCACFQGSTAGCNTLAHFAKDFVRSCQEQRVVQDSCTIAGYVHQHGVLVPDLNGRSFKRDPGAARSAFETACAAGSEIACAEVR